MIPKNTLITNASNNFRIFANQILVSWKANPSQELSVDIKVGGQLYKLLSFDGTSSQQFRVQSPPNRLNGKFTAIFYADGKSGQLDSDIFRWDLNGQKSFFNGGTIGLWQETSLEKRKCIARDKGLTTSISRTFGTIISVELIPDFSDIAISVAITSGNNLLKIIRFATSGSKTFDINQGDNITASGEFTAVFQAGELRGRLIANQFAWNINGQKGSFQGDIGTW